MNSKESEREFYIQEALKFAKKHSNSIGEPQSISNEAYQKFIRAQAKELKFNWNKNKFMIFANLKNNNLDALLSTNEVMGWAADMTIEDYFRAIHPDYLIAYLSWSMAVYELSRELRVKLKPFKQVYQLQVPLQHQSGKYFWCTMQGIPIRLDKDNNMVFHFNIYQRMEEMTEFNHRLFQPFLVDKLEVMEEWNKRLAAKMKKFALKGLHPKDLKTIRLGLEGKHTKEIALELKETSKDTVMKYKKEILKRGRQVGGNVFYDADVVGRYFKMMGWIE